MVVSAWVVTRITVRVVRTSLAWEGIHKQNPQVCFLASASRFPTTAESKHRQREAVCSDTFLLLLIGVFEDTQALLGALAWGELLL